MIATELPPWRSVLAVVAHPDDESFGLGAVLATFVASGARVSVLCFTHGEASTLHEVEGDLASIRARELEAAAHELGITNVYLKSYVDGALQSAESALLEADVEDVVADVDPDGFVVFDSRGVTSHPDHQRATQVAQSVAARRGLGVVGWTIPASVAGQLNAEFNGEFIGHDDSHIDFCVAVDRTSQLQAIACHPSQVVPGSVLWRRLELLGVHEYLRWLPTA